jgi:hypothetical protein
MDRTSTDPDLVEVHMSGSKAIEEDTARRTLAEKASADPVKVISCYSKSYDIAWLST